MTKENLFLKDNFINNKSDSGIIHIFCISIQNLKKQILNNSEMVLR